MDAIGGQEITMPVVQPRLGAAGDGIGVGRLLACVAEECNDADLIGVPIRMTVSARTVADGKAELKLRRDAQPSRVPLQTAAAAGAEAWAALHTDLCADRDERP